MALPTCPACKQSVLDDDAVDCPFCGASMKGKPGAAKAAAPKAAAAAPAKPAPRPARPFAATPSSITTDDAPFDLTDPFAPQATAAVATRTKTRSLAVQCPMCETVGYVSPDSAGKSVKCVNPKCMMPVFTAPRPELEKPPEAKPVKRKSNLPLVGGVTLAIMAVGGGLAWWIASQPNSITIAAPSLEDLELLKEAGKASVQKKTTPPQPVEPEPVEPSAATAAETQDSQAERLARVLKVLNDSALQQRQNRSKPYCRRLTAEAFALTGDLDGAKSQLEALARVGGEVPFYRVMPLTQLAWQQLAAGQKKAAAKSVDDAWSVAEKLPKSGRDRLESAIALSALLIATNREADAQKLLAKHHSADDVAQLAQAHRAVQALASFDLAEFEARQPALPWTAPLTIGVVHELTAHQQSNTAKNWAAALTKPREKAEALAAWADSVVWRASLRGQKPAVDKLRAGIESLPFPGNVLALSRLGVSLALTGQDAAAGECLSLAADWAADFEPLGDVELPEDLKELSRFKSPDFAERSYEIAAAGELAHLAAQLGRREQAEKLLGFALERARALAASPAAVQVRQKAIKAGGLPALRERLKQEWKLKTDTDAVVAATGLQKNLDELLESAQRRVELQRQLLSQAIAWGLQDSVWAYIHRGSTRDDAAQADNLIFTQLPELLAEKFRATGQPDRAEAVAKAWNTLVPDQALSQPLAAQLDAALNSDSESDLQRGAELIQEIKGNPALQDGLALRAVCRLVAAKKSTAALRFASAIDDSVLKEECYLLIGGLAGRRGETAGVEPHLQELGQASEKVALGRGLIAGWVAAAPPTQEVPGS